KAIWQRYFDAFVGLKVQGVGLPSIPAYATNSGHMFYLVARSLDERTALINFLKERQILPVFHYLSLHKSPFYADKHDGRQLPWADHYTDCLLRLPLYYELHPELQQRVVDGVLAFYQRRDG
ncbi:MAG: dTDP-4-amino-4,6-dideoxygalactose transaminase, partial [Hymenobacter sp.]